MASFELNERLRADSQLVTNLGLCQLRLMEDSRWPWFVLIPQRPGIEEVFELTPLDQAMLTFETNLVGQALKKSTNATKINVGALGNIVRQLHVHVIARQENDANWPGPIWGFGARQAYDDTARQQLITKVMESI